VSPSNNDKTSEETKVKYAQFGQLIEMHTNIVKGIYGRSDSTQPYLYVDMNAGSPQKQLDGEWRNAIGSQAIHTIQSKFPRFKLFLIEEKEQLINGYREQFGYLGESARFITGKHGNLEGCWAEVFSLARMCRPYGLVCHDPWGVPSYETLQSVFRQPGFEKVDLLLYMTATTPKRVIGAYGEEGCMSLDRALEVINKKYWLIRELHTHQQWTFVLGANYEYPEWRNAEFYRVDSSEGQEILERATLTNKQQKMKYGAQPTLFDLSGISKTPNLPSNPAESH
jgi:hypothetical protein